MILSQLKLWCFLVLILSSLKAFGHDSCECDCKGQPKHSFHSTPGDIFKSFHERMSRFDKMFGEMAFGFPDQHSDLGLDSLQMSSGVETKLYDDNEGNKIVEIIPTNGKRADLNVDVKGDLITISINETQENQTTSDKGFSSQSYFKSVSKKVIPVPEDVLSEQVQIENDEGKLILKFPKKRV